MRALAAGCWRDAVITEPLVSEQEAVPPESSDGARVQYSRDVIRTSLTPRSRLVMCCVAPS
jgi:hypothetical protein